MKKYEYILFDLDGTIIDSGLGVTNSVKYSLKKFGIDETDFLKLKKFVGPPLYDSYEKYYGFSREKAITAVEYYREYYTDKGIFELKVYEGILEQLKLLKESGKKLILATSKPEIFAEKIAEKFDFLKYFYNISGSLLDGSRVRKADIISYALTRIGVSDKEKCLMVGDTVFDILGAREIGIDSLGVTWGYGEVKEIESVFPTYIINRPNEIKDILSI